jgi:deoxyadenosine/deoxycytidine kinase
MKGFMFGHRKSLEELYDNLRNQIIPLLHEVKSELDILIYNETDLEKIKERLYKLQSNIVKIENEMDL